MKFKALTLLFGFIIIVTSATAQTNPKAGPFGIKWGISLDEARNILPGFEKRDGATHTFDAAAAGIADAALGLVEFTDSGGLYKLTVVGSDFGADPYASVLRSRINELKALLEEKYGSSENRTIIADGYDGSDFRLGLQVERNRYGFLWPDADGVEIALSAFISSDIGTTWMLMYTEKTGDSEVNRAVANKEKASL
jgi:hypothetical protein